MPLPWTDHRGGPSPLKAAVFVMLFLPASWTAAAYALDLLGPRPLNGAIHEVGLWAFRWLLIALAIAPARHVLAWPTLPLVRRMVGVAAFCYAGLHLLLYMLDQEFDIAKIAAEIALRFYLAIGFCALLGLLALAATSTDRMMRRLGRRWRRLHQTVYAIGILAAIHYFMQSKLEIYEPTVMAGVYLWLMGYRIIASRRRDGRPSLSQVAAIGIAAALLTAAGEAVYFWSTTSVDPERIVLANLTLVAGVRPAGWVLASAGAAWLLAALRRSAARRRSGLRLGEA
jgi:sulfoxide reductase heme-binding subunit YedZ